MEVTVHIDAQGRVSLILPGPTPVPVVEGEQLPAAWQPSPGSGQATLQVTFGAPAADGKRRPAPAPARH